MRTLPRALRGQPGRLGTHAVRPEAEHGQPDQVPPNPEAYVRRRGPGEQAQRGRVQRLYSTA